MTDDNTTTSMESDDRLGRFKQRALLGLVAVVVTVLSWYIGASVIPRWWAQRVGDLVDGRLRVGAFFGFTMGLIFSVLALSVLWIGWRFRKGWRRAILTLLAAALVLSPNLATLGIVAGDGNAAHAGERILDVDGPGFRGGTLIGTIFGVLIVLAWTFLVTSRARNKRNARDLKAELNTQ